MSAAQGLESVPTAPQVNPTNQHLLAQLLLEFQWTAALCRIWPSSIPDAAPLHNLLSGALAAAADLVADLLHMQADTRALRAAAASGVCSVDVASTAAAAAAAATSAAAQLLVPASAALMEVAALVLEPLGMLLYQLQEACRKGKQPAMFSVPARDLCGKLQGGSTATLQAMLTVCLHQLVLHAERKLGTSETLGLMQQHASKRSAALSTTASIGTAPCSSSASRSITEAAEGYLLQYADTLQVQPPALPSRAALLAWEAVCERQWAAGSLPLTLQAAVLASTQLGVASTLGSVGSAGNTAAAVWDMQDCGLLAGHFGVLGGGASRASTDTSGRACSGRNAVNSAVGSVHAPSTGYTSSSCGNSPGSAQRSDPAAVGSKPLRSIASCIHKGTALSAACQHMSCLQVDNNISASSGSSSTFGLACSLLATAAAALSLQGAAALPFVSSALPAATNVVQSMRLVQASAQHPVEAAGTEQHLHDAAAVGPNASGSSTQPQAAAAPPAAIPAAVSAPVGNVWLCLSFAAELTTAVLHLQGLEGEQEEQLSPARFASIQCGMLLQVLLRCISAQACAKDSAMQLQQLQSVAYTVQLVEATVRLSADPEALPLAEASQGAAQLQPRRLGADKVCGGTALAVVESALSIILKAGQTVLGSLQGQQLLQSCTSLLLTCCSLLQRLGSAASPVDMSLCVHLLQLLQHSDALVTGGSSCSMFQSLAAGLAAAGRSLVVLGALLQPTLECDSSSSALTQAKVDWGIAHMNRLTTCYQHALRPQ